MRDSVKYLLIILMLAISFPVAVLAQNENFSEIDWKILSEADEGPYDWWYILPSDLWMKPDGKIGLTKSSNTNLDLFTNYSSLDSIYEKVDTTRFYENRFEDYAVVDTAGIGFQNNEPQFEEDDLIRWKLKDEVCGGRAWSHYYYDVTERCEGMIDVEFALTPEQWEDREIRKAYFARVDNLIDNVSDKLLEDITGDELKERIKNSTKLENWEKNGFLDLVSVNFNSDEISNLKQAFKAVIWTENEYQHYLRYDTEKDVTLFFVILGGNLPDEGGNYLDDYASSCIARSGYYEEGSNRFDLYNREFFRERGYCSIYSTIYYGLAEYLLKYIYAKNVEFPEGVNCNDGELEGNPYLKTLIGAYGSYVTGFSACYDILADYDPDWQKQVRINFFHNFTTKPWLKRMSQG